MSQHREQRARRTLDTLKTKAALLTTILAQCSVDARADARIPKVFADHMVLQQGMPIAVWGRAEPANVAGDESVAAAWSRVAP